MKILQTYRTKGGWFFRIFGWGITAKDTRIHQPLFSERNRLIRWYRIGAWSWTFLYPNDFLIIKRSR